MSKVSELDSISTVLKLQQNEVLNTFTKMWYHVFLWALLSSIVVHAVSQHIQRSTHAVYDSLLYVSDSRIHSVSNTKKTQIWQIFSNCNSIDGLYNTSRNWYC